MRMTPKRITIHRYEAAISLFVYSMLLSAALIYHPSPLNAVLFPLVVIAVVYSAHKLAFGSGPEQTESGDKRAGKPSSKVAAAALFKAKVGEDSDETSEYD